MRFSSDDNIQEQHVILFLGFKFGIYYFCLSSFGDFDSELIYALEQGFPT